jgi:hypothetical protein
MKTYVVELGFSTDFYPPLTKEQVVELNTQNLFQPLRSMSKNMENELRIIEELNLIGSVIIEASEKTAKAIRGAGFTVHLNSIKKAL